MSRGISFEMPFSRYEPSTSKGRSKTKEPVSTSTATWRKLTMTARASRYVAGAAAGLALTASLAGCKADAGKSKASGDETPTSGVHLTAAQEALSKASQKTAGLTSFRATLATSTVVSGKTTHLKGNLQFQLKPRAAMRFDVPSVTTGGTTNA